MKNAINSEHSSELNCQFDDFLQNNTMVENLKLIYKKYGFGEFKKAHFAAVLNEYISLNTTKEDFANSEITEIIKLIK